MCTFESGIEPFLLCMVDQARGERRYRFKSYHMRIYINHENDVGASATLP